MEAHGRSDNVLLESGNSLTLPTGQSSLTAHVALTPII